MQGTLIHDSLRSFALLAAASLALGFVLALSTGGLQLWLLPLRILAVIVGAIALSIPGLFVGLSFSSLAPSLRQFGAALQSAARASAWVLLGLLPALAFVLASAGLNKNDAVLLAAPLVLIAALLFARRLQRALLRPARKQPTDSVHLRAGQSADRRSSTPGLPPLEQKLLQNHASAWLVFFIWEAVFLGIGMIDYVHVFTKVF